MLQLSKIFAFAMLAFMLADLVQAQQLHLPLEKAHDTREYFSQVGPDSQSSLEKENDPAQYPVIAVSQEPRSIGCPQQGCSACARGSVQYSGCCSACQSAAELDKIEKNPCESSHKVLFFNNDFSYLNDCDYCGHCLGDSLKQMDVGCCGKLDIGGQWRLRYHHEVGMNKGAQRFLSTLDDFLLNRLRLYGNYQVNEDVRFYVEGIYADSYFESRPPRNIDVNEGDFLNYFVDVKLADEVTVRAGRQQLQYGAERLVSPLDWANTMRTFEGIKIMLRPTDWAIDIFYTNLVPPLPYELDRVDYNQQFYGVWATYNGLRDATLDLYHLGDDNRQAVSAFSMQTTGARLNGKTSEIMYELQGGYQYGDATGVNMGSHSAGFVTAGLGTELQNGYWDPTLWVFFDYASEDFNQLFPLSHKYLGFIDAVQRSNIVSPNVLLTAKPHDQVSFLLWYYYFLSASGAPVLSIGGTPNQNSDRDFGQELDFIVKYQISPRSDLLVGYSHFWRGDKILNPSDADFTYLQWTLNF